MQVLGFVSRSARVWAVLFGAAFVTRTALDWLAPPVDFHARSTVSTFLGAGILVAAGLWASLRSGSLFAATLTGVAATAIGAVISAIGAAGPLAIRHDADTMARKTTQAEVASRMRILAALRSACDVSVVPATAKSHAVNARI